MNPNNSERFSDQFAFRPTGSCEAALILLLDKITSYLISSDYVCLISYDLSKAFNTISHDSVMKSLTGYWYTG